jgi:hypothetical protein
MLGAFIAALASLADTSTRMYWNISMHGCGCDCNLFQASTTGSVSKMGEAAGNEWVLTWSCEPFQHAAMLPRITISMNGMWSFRLCCATASDASTSAARCTGEVTEWEHIVHANGIK